MFAVFRVYVSARFTFTWNGMKQKTPEFCVFRKYEWQLLVCMLLLLLLLLPFFIFLYRFVLCKHGFTCNDSAWNVTKFKVFSRLFLCVLFLIEKIYSRLRTNTNELLASDYHRISKAVMYSMMDNYQRPPKLYINFFRFRVLFNSQLYRYLWL